MPAPIVLQSSTQLPLLFMLVSSTDHISPVTGATPTVSISKNGAAGVTPSGTVSEVDSTNLPGLYKVAGNATDTNTLGAIFLHATATGADPTDALVAQVVAFDPTNANLGLTDVSANVAQWGGTAVGSIPPDVIFLHSGTAQGGASGSITLDSGASATNGLYDNCVVFIRSGTGAGQSNIITAYTGTTKVATVGGAWATPPDNTSVFTIMAVGPVQATISGTVDANVIQIDGQSVQTDGNGLMTVDVGDWDGTPVASGYTDIALAIANFDMATANITNDYSPGNAWRFLRNKWSISGTTLTVYAENGSTVAWTGALTMTAGAEPVTGNSPS